jgi:hypothetical protein
VETVGDGPKRIALVHGFLDPGIRHAIRDLL